MAIVLDGSSGITNDSGYTGDGVRFADSTPANTLVTTSGGNVGIGTSSPASRLHIADSSGGGSGRIRMSCTVSAGYDSRIFQDDTGLNFSAVSDSRSLVFRTGNSDVERMRIDSSGNLLVGTTSNTGVGRIVSYAATSAIRPIETKVDQAGAADHVAFWSSSGFAGRIVVTGTTTAYNTSSDYRLKENVHPITGALARISALKPCTYTWKHDGSVGEGFIAHELQEVVPLAVSGEKDEVNPDGSIRPQGIDTSFLVATLTAAIQEQQALIESLTARVVALENQIV